MAADHRILKEDHLSAVRFLHSVVRGILEKVKGCLYSNICKQYFHIYSSIFIWVKVIIRSILLVLYLQSVRAMVSFISFPNEKFYRLLGSS